LPYLQYGSFKMLLKNIILVAFSTIVSQGNVASALPTNPVMNARSIPGPGQTAALLPRVLPDQLDAPVARGLQTRAAWDYNTLAGYIGSTAVYGSMLWGVEKCGAYCLRAAGVNYEAKIGKWAAAVVSRFATFFSYQNLEPIYIALAGCLRTSR
jgi:hypothetical protein